MSRAPKSELYNSVKLRKRPLADSIVDDTIGDLVPAKRARDSSAASSKDKPSCQRVQSKNTVAMAKRTRGE